MRRVGRVGECPRLPDRRFCGFFSQRAVIPAMTARFSFCPVVVVGIWYNRGMCMKPQAAINYRNGWFFVTSQVAHNKSIFGAIAGERCELNVLGREVEKYWRELPTKYPELELFDFVVMPNHFHAIVRIR